MFTSLRITWTWLSISPGISVRPPQSTTSARSRLDRFLGDLPDGLTLDQEFEAALKLADFGLEQLEIPKQQLRHVIPRDASIGQRHASAHKAGRASDRLHLLARKRAQQLPQICIERRNLLS